MLKNHHLLCSLLITFVFFSHTHNANNEQVTQKICSEIITIDSIELTEEQHLALLHALINQVKQGKCIDQALTTLYSLLYSQNPRIQEKINELSHAIAQWCISTIDEIFA